MVGSKEERPIEHDPFFRPVVRVVESLCGLELVAEKSSSTKKEKCNSREREGNCIVLDFFSRDSLEVPLSK